jgi:hypothetical protein
VPEGISGRALYRNGHVGRTSVEALINKFAVFIRSALMDPDKLLGSMHLGSVQCSLAR